MSMMGILPAAFDIARTHGIAHVAVVLRDFRPLRTNPFPVRCAHLRANIAAASRLISSLKPLHTKLSQRPKAGCGGRSCREQVDGQPRAQVSGVSANGYGSFMPLLHVCITAATAMAGAPSQAREVGRAYLRADAYTTAWDACTPISVRFCPCARVLREARSETGIC